MTYVTELVRSGASVKACQTLARHSTPTLTLATYTKLGIDDLTGALEGLPALGAKAPEREAMGATGTYDNRPADAAKPRKLICELNGRETVRSPAMKVTE